MLITLENGVDPGPVRRELAARGLWVTALEGQQGSSLLVQPGSREVDPDSLRGIRGVLDVAVGASGTPLVDSQTRPVDVAGVAIGPGLEPALIAGPCSIESPEQIDRLAALVSSHGAKLLRGGAFKPRTSPYAFQGHGSEALSWMAEAGKCHDLRVVTEVMSSADVDQVAAVADMLQIGSRNMQNSTLLGAAGSAGKPILLKRGMAATVEEWLSAGEYCLKHGASGVVFCERGIRSFDTSTRNLLDLGAVALMAHVHRQPVIVDPSHGAGRTDLIAPLSKAALAAGAHGLLIEVHDDPGNALSDGPQALSPAALRELVTRLQPQLARNMNATGIPGAGSGKVVS